MSAKPKYSITNRSAAISVGRKSHTFKAGTDEYQKAKESARTGDWSWLIQPTAPKGDGKAGIRIKDGNLEVNDPLIGWNVPPVGWQELYKRYEDSTGVSALVNMWHNLRKADPWIQTQVINSLRIGRFAIRPNGNLVMFRGVHFRNGIMTSGNDGSRWGGFGVKRRETYFNTSTRATCVAGLHAAPWDTVRSVYGHQTIIEVDIEPHEMVAIPTEDYYPKIRASAMTPIRFCPNDPGYGMFAPPAMIEMKGEETVSLDQNEKEVRKNKPMHEAASASHKAQQKLTEEGVPMKSGEFVLDFTTDRITIPNDKFELCGFVDKGAVKIYYTDPRARFMLVTRTTGIDKDFFRSCGILKRPDFEFDYDASSNRSVSIRHTSLANCNIYGFERYKVEAWVHNDQRYVTIRPMK